MTTIKDARGYSQGYKPSLAMTVRTKRRCDYIINRMSLTTKLVDILEIGCGTGEISHLLAQKTSKQVLGTDISKLFIDSARENFNLPNLKFEVLDFNNAKQLTDKKFDYIVGNGILHHLFYGLDHSLENMYRLLATGGKLIFLEPNIYNPYCSLIFKIPSLRKMTHLEPSEMAFSKKFIKTKLAKHGFANIEVAYRDFLLPNTPQFLIKTVIGLGSWLERIPLLNMLSQSIFISASHP